MIIYKQKDRTHFDDFLFDNTMSMTDFWCDTQLVWLCEYAWLEMDVVALAAQRSYGSRVADATQTPVPITS